MHQLPSTKVSGWLRARQHRSVCESSVLFAVARASASGLCFISFGRCLPPYLHKDLGAVASPTFPTCYFSFLRCAPCLPPSPALVRGDNLAQHPPPTEGIFGGFLLCVPFIPHTQTPSSHIHVMILNGNVTAGIHLFIKCLPWYPRLTRERHGVLGSFWSLSTSTERILGSTMGFLPSPLRRHIRVFCEARGVWGLSQPGPSCTQGK